MKKKNIRKFQKLARENEYLKFENGLLRTVNSVQEKTIINLLDEDELPEIKNIVFKEPYTTIYFADHTKSVAKCHPNDTFSKEQGVLVALAKYVYGNRLYQIMNQYCSEKKETEVSTVKEIETKEEE